MLSRLSSIFLYSQYKWLQSLLNKLVLQIHHTMLKVWVETNVCCLLWQWATEKAERKLKLTALQLCESGNPSTTSIENTRPTWSSERSTLAGDVNHRHQDRFVPPIFMCVLWGDPSSGRSLAKLHHELGPARPVMCLQAIFLQEHDNSPRRRPTSSTVCENDMQDSEPRTPATTKICSSESFKMSPFYLPNTLLSWHCYVAWTFLVPNDSLNTHQPATTHSTGEFAIAQISAGANIPADILVPQNEGSHREKT